MSGGHSSVVVTEAGEGGYSLWWKLLCIHATPYLLCIWKEEEKEMTLYPFLEEHLKILLKNHCSHVCVTMPSVGSVLRKINLTIYVSMRQPIVMEMASPLVPLLEELLYSNPIGIWEVCVFRQGKWAGETLCVETAPYSAEPEPSWGGRLCICCVSYYQPSMTMCNLQGN